MKSKHYNRIKEKNLTKELISNPSEKIKYYQVAFYDYFGNDKLECFDETFYMPDEEEIAKSYLKHKDDKVKIFAIYEDGYEEEL